MNNAFLNCNFEGDCIGDVSRRPAGLYFQIGKILQLFSLQEGVEIHMLTASQQR